MKGVPKVRQPPQGRAGAQALPSVSRLLFSELHAASFVNTAADLRGQPEGRQRRGGLLAVQFTSLEFKHFSNPLVPRVLWHQEQAQACKLP